MEVILLPTFHIILDIFFHLKKQQQLFTFKPVFLKICDLLKGNNYTIFLISRADNKTGNLITNYFQIPKQNERVLNFLFIS